MANLAHNWSHQTKAASRLVTGSHLEPPKALGSSFWPPNTTALSAKSKFNSPKGPQKLPANVLCKRAFSTYLLVQFSLLGWQKEKYKFTMQPRKTSMRQRNGRKNIGKAQRCQYSFFHVENVMVGWNGAAWIMRRCTENYKCLHYRCHT